MSNNSLSHPTYKNLDVARKKLPKTGSPQRILILNKQGLPIMQMSRVDDFDIIIDDRECGEVAELARKVSEDIKSFRGLEPERVAFFFKDEIITVEIEGPFIILMIWSEKAFTTNSNMENFLERLKGTLYQELN